MTARAMWKGVIGFGGVRVPVKLYAAVEDRDVHFRLLHATDHAPVRQALVNPEADEVVPYREAHRAFATPEGDLVLLKDEELAEMEPEPSREIRILRFLPPDAIDRRWYLRPYYLGPDDGAADAYFALAAALARVGRVGLARWVMRNKEYLGALRLQSGYPMLVALHHAEEVVSLEGLGTPAGPSLDHRELAMARQLMDMLAADFVPTDYRDEYRARVEQLIETKMRGGRLAVAPPRRPRPSEDLAGALEASLRRERRHA
jgi:DNA end-binding protein Ku